MRGGAYAKARDPRDVPRLEVLVEGNRAFEGRLHSAKRMVSKARQRVCVRGDGWRGSRGGAYARGRTLLVPAANWLKPTQAGLPPYRAPRGAVKEERQIVTSRYPRAYRPVKVAAAAERVAWCKGEGCKGMRTYFFSAQTTLCMFLPSALRLTPTTRTIKFLYAKTVFEVL